MLSREELLDQVQRNVDVARRMVDRQRWLIAKLEADGHDTQTAQHLQLAFERSQAMFEHELAALLYERTTG